MKQGGFFRHKMARMPPLLDHHSFFVVRLTAQPISQLLGQFDRLKATEQTDQLPFLLDWLNKPGTWEALYLASPSLVESLETQLTDLSASSSLVKTLWRYALRLYSRPIPFGLFAGCGVGKIGAAKEIEFGPTPWQAISRPDSMLTQRVSQILLEDSLVRRQLRYQLNNSLYRVSNEYRFSQRSFTWPTAQINLAAISESPELNQVVASLQAGRDMTFNELIGLFPDDPVAEVDAFIHSLIDAQFLTSSLLFSVTEGDMARALVTRTNHLRPIPPYLKTFRHVQERLANEPVTIDSLHQSQQALTNLFAPTDALPVIPGSLIQTDLFFNPNKLVLPQALINEIAGQYLRLVPILDRGVYPSLGDFAERFRERYGDADVDLLTALDPQYGIGYSRQSGQNYPLIADLFPDADPPGPAAPPRHAALLDRLYRRFLLNGQLEAEITETDLAAIEPTDQPKSTALSWYLFGQLYDQPLDGPDSESADRPKRSSWRFAARPISNGSAAYLLGRFCYGNDSLRQAVASLCEWEQAQQPDELLAEVVHLPPIPLRAGNVVSRPVLRTYEIPYLSAASVSKTNTIRLEDLCIRVTASGEVQLRHKQTGQRVRPRLSTAHTFVLGDDIYQFLGHVGRAEFNKLGWDWVHLAKQPMLPRLVYKNLILSPAQWTIRVETTVGTAPLSCQQVRALYKLPRYVLLMQSDNFLLLDLDIELCQTILLEELQKTGEILVSEWLSQFFRPWLRQGEDVYESEVIIPLKTTIPTLPVSSRQVGPIKTYSETAVQRDFIPGQDWLYYKVYLHESAADLFLTAMLPKVLSLARKKGWCTTFFFIRYNDPRFHLRLRFQYKSGTAAKLIALCDRFFRPAHQSGLVHQLQLDTYQRELERYQPELIGDCETIFAADSQFILTYLTQSDLASTVNPIDLALLSADALLSDFGFDLAQKAPFFAHLQQAFLSEQTDRKRVKQKLNDRYRVYALPFRTIPSRLKVILEERYFAMRPAIKTIQHHFSLYPDPIGYQQVVSSLLHMNLNRIFTGQARRHELMAYHYLSRYYDSQVARLKKEIS